VTKVGTRGVLDDGRVYYYARAVSATPLVAGNLLTSEAASVDHDDMAVDTYAVGAKSLAVTPVGTKTYTANELAEGYACCNSGTTGPGWAVKIKSHAAVTAATEYTINLYDGIPVALAENATIHVAKNPWMDPVVMPTSGAGQPAGVSNVAVPDGSTDAQYFWCQTWGIACVTAGSASAVGDALMADTSTAGETLIATAGNPVIGNAYTLGVDGDFVLAFLTIAP